MNYFNGSLQEDDFEQDDEEDDEVLELD